jgi:hypothetical protein
MLASRAARRFVAFVLAIPVLAGGGEHGSRRNLRAATPPDDTLGIELRQPVYRNAIFPTEQIPNLRFAIGVSDAPRVARLVFALEDSARRGVRVGSSEGGSIAAEQSLDVRALPPGDYSLVVRAFDSRGAEVAHGSTPVRKLVSAPGSEVRIDERHNIVVDGKPTVLIGWYGEVPLDDPRADVVRLQNVQAPITLGGLDSAALAAARNAYRLHGVYSIISLEPQRLATTLHLSPEAARELSAEWTGHDAPTEAAAAYMKQVVDAVRSERWLIGYYLADEPESHGVRGRWLEAAYRLLSRADPYHPVIITNDTPSGMDTHGVRASDILNPDVYSRDPGYVAAFLEHARSVRGPGQATMLTTWAAAGQAHFTREWGSDPAYSFATMRQQFLLSIAFGIRGWTAYTSAFFFSEPSLRFGLPHVWRELRFLAAAMEDPADPPAVDDNGVVTWLGRAEGHVYLVAVNRGTQTRIVRIGHPLLAAVQALDVVGEDRVVRVTNGALADTFAPGAARVYATDPRGRSLTTIPDVDKEIAASVAAAGDSGDLLYVGRGVRAYASPGYFAPWFSQYFYYAINGVTDDTGWQVSKVTGPEWLDLTLPKEADIGRVVVHTPNLQDYDLLFRAADGSVRIAEIRGNTAEISEHSFFPAVPALKLRITALKVRGTAGPAGAIVREIGAYASGAPGIPTPWRTVHAAPAPGRPGIGSRLPATDSAMWTDSLAGLAPASNPGNQAWILDPSKVRVKASHRAGAEIASIADAGYASMTRRVPFDSAFRYLQLKIDSIEPRGYDWVALEVGAADGQRRSREALRTRVPGVYTVDMYALDNSFRAGAARAATLSVTVAGAVKHAGGGVDAGPAFSLGWLRLAREPANGLFVTMADGSPLRERLRPGDTVTFRVHLEQPASDVSVELRAGSAYDPVFLNGEPYVQLERAGTADGRAWSATVVLRTDTVPADGSGAYPILFRAVVTGGAIRSTLATSRLRIE